MPSLTGVLGSLRVVDLSDGIAGAYCSKLLADAGAQLVRIEPPGGSELRHRTLSECLGADGSPDGALFRFLCSSAEVCEADLLDREARKFALEVLGRSDVVVLGPADPAGLDAATLMDVREGHIRIRISPFGTGGPAAPFGPSGLLLQARAGALDVHRSDDGQPLAIGGDFLEWAAGAYAALGGITALAARRRSGHGDVVDVSMLECAALTLSSYPSLTARFPGTRRGLRATFVSTVFPCADGFVSLCPYTGQQWLDLFALIGRADLAGDQRMEDPEERSRRSEEVIESVRAWSHGRSAEEIVALAGLFRVPAAPVANGATLPIRGQLAARGFYEDAGGFVAPRPPFRYTPANAAEPETPLGSVGERVLEGVTVLDLSSFWSGPFATQYLASIGADVIKVEAPARPDPMRLGALVPPSDPSWFEKGAMFHAANLGKRSIVLDLSDHRGRQVALALAARADVVVENATPRVLDQLELSYGHLAAVHPGIILVRMPAFGLEGPWRDLPGFAATVEAASGIAWVTGSPTGPPVPPGGVCDPLAGVHAAFATLLAIEERRVNGRGGEVEVAMLEVAANVTAEQVIEHSAYGALVSRCGNRRMIRSLQGVYRCCDQGFIALAVEDDEHLARLAAVLERPEWATDAGFATVAGRLSQSGEFDSALEDWCSGRKVADALAVLTRHNVPVSRVVPGHEIDQDEHMRARGFWQWIDHPIVGQHPYPGWPFTLQRGSPRYRGAAPRFGEHTAEVLHELGLSLDEIERLQASGVTSDRPVDD